MNSTRTMRRFAAATLACAVLLGAPAANALDPGVALTQYGQRTWLADDSEGALPQNSVFSIVQTRDGYLWLATQEGLARFDGVRFEVFNKRNTPAIHHNDVWKLLEDHAGNLWIATRGGGLVRYGGGAFTTFAKEQGLADDSVQALYEDHDGALWIGTRGGGLTRLRDGKFTTFTRKDGLSNDTVFAIHEDRAGTLWIGTDGGGLTRYRDGKFDSITTHDGLSHDTVYAISEDRAGNLWIGTGAGLNRLQDGKLTAYGVKDGLSNDNVRSILEDRAGNLWIGTDGGGLNRLHDGRFSALTTHQGLSNDSIGAIYEDRENNLWIGTDAGGLVRFKDTRFRTFAAPEGLTNDNARAILEDHTGSLWIGTFGGVNRIHDGRVTAFTKKDGLSSDVVLSLAEDRDGSLWLGTLGGGLDRYKDGRFTAYAKKDGLSNDTVLSLLQDRDGALWIGTRSGGLDRFEHGAFRTYTTADGLTSNDVRVLHQGADGALWIGTLGGGLNRLKDGKFTAITKADGLSNDMVLSLHEDADGTLWIGTFGGGLNRLRHGKITAYTSANGLYDDAVFQILADDGDDLWMSSNHGVYRVARRMLDDFADGRIHAITSTPYGKADGMRSAEGNGAHQPAGCRARDGRLWFPTTQGVVSVDPAHLLANTLPPPVRIEQLLVDGESLPLRAQVDVAAGQKKLEFHYTALSYVAPELVRFKYKLDGFDPDWVDAGSKRAAYYTNLAPGDYRFLVKASNNDGVWNEQGAALALNLRPFFYQTRAFYGVYVLGALLLVAIGMQFRHVRVRWLQVRERELLKLVQEREAAENELQQAHQALLVHVQQLARSNAELERFAYVASHDLKEPLRAVISFTQLLARKYHGRLDDEANQYIGFAVDAAQSMRAQIENLLSYSRVGRRVDEAATADCAAAMAQALGNLRTAIDESAAVITHGPLPWVRAHPSEVVQLLQNLVGNAIKFHEGAAPRVHVSCDAEPGGAQWRFCVSDNGIGIEAQHLERIFGLFQRLNVREKYPGTGIGLAVCRKIVESCGGRIWVESPAGQGSRFYFTLPALATAAAGSDAQPEPLALTA